MNTTLYGNAKILIVEDESIIVKSLENRLLKAGYDVIGNAASGKEAIEMARQLNPDLILMDIKLDGEMTGIEAASEINKFLNIPIIYLTSYSDENTFQKARITNPFAYLHKPFDGEQLQRILDLTLINHSIKKKHEQTKKRYEIALEAGNTAVWEILIRNREIYYDRNLRSLYGYEEFELSNQLNDWFYLIHPEDLSLVQEIFESLFKGVESSYKLEYRIIRKNRTVGWVSTQLKLIRSEDGKPLRVIGATTDITERRLSEQALRKSEEKFRSIFESAGIGMAIIGPDTRFTKVNQSLCDMTGYSGKDYLNFYLNDIIDTEDYGKAKLIVDQLLVDKISGPQQLEFRLKNSDGNIVWSSTSISLVKDFKRRPLYFIVILQNVSRRKEAEQKLKEYADELKNSNAAKDKFFSIISHDLRNPFHTILGASEFLSMYAEDLTMDEFKETSSNIYSAAKNVYNLLTNLLEWARVQTGKLEVKKSIFGINELFSSMIELYQENADHKKISLINEYSGRHSISADRYMIEAVLRNLVSNAIKFTKSGGTVVLSAEDIGDFISISVNDNGIGIATEDTPKLFNYDQHFSLKGTNNETGTGLGLAICKDFVEKNGGQISVESKKGSGSTFKVFLPNNKK
jgi:PAS domain S-box-containing protein